MKRLSIISLAALLILSITACNNKKKERTNTNNNNTVLKQNNYSFDNPPVFRNDGQLSFIDSETQEVLLAIEIEVASTDIERATGLMYRAEMIENRGMLFLFAADQMQSFFMRNTIISLDIIYVNSDMEIVDFYANAIPLDETSLPSAAPAKYVVEINGGLCEKYSIEVGDKIVF